MAETEAWGPEHPDYSPGAMEARARMLKMHPGLAASVADGTAALGRRLQALPGATRSSTSSATRSATSSVSPRAANATRPSPLPMTKTQIQQARMARLLGGAATKAFQAVVGWLKSLIESQVGDLSTIDVRIKDFFKNTLTGIVRDILAAAPKLVSFLTDVDSTLVWLLGLVDTTYAFTTDVTSAITVGAEYLVEMGLTELNKLEGFQLFKGFLIDVNNSLTTAVQVLNAPNDPTGAITAVLDAAGLDEYIPAVQNAVPAIINITKMVVTAVAKTNNTGETDMIKKLANVFQNSEWLSR